MSSDIIKLIKTACNNSNQYSSLYSNNNSSKNDTVIISDKVYNLISNYNLSINSKNGIDPHSENNTIFLPDKNTFYSSSNYNHVILHEVNHRISLQNNLSDDYKKAYIAYSKDKSATHDFEGIFKTFSNGNISSLTESEKNLAAAYSKDETVIELCTYSMMKKIGIEPDKRDTAYTLWNIAENNKTLEALGKGFAKDYIAMGEIYKRTEKLLSISVKAYENANNIKIDNHKSNEKEQSK